MTTAIHDTKDGTPVEFEDAVSATGYGVYNLSLLLVCGGLLMAVIMETISMSYILPAAQCDLELTLSDKSMLSAVSFLGVVLSSMLWGYLGDTVGRKKVVLITTLVSFIVSLASSFSPYTWLFITLRFFNGFFIGGPSAVTYAYLGEFHNNVHRARVLSWAAAFIAFAMFTLPALAWLVLPMQWAITLPGTSPQFTWRPWRLLIILNAIPGLISASCLLMFPESPKFLWVNGRTDEVLNIFRKMYARNTGKPESEYPVKQIVEHSKQLTDNGTRKATMLLKSVWQQTAPLFCVPLILKTLMTCTLQFGVFASSSGILMWTPELLNRMSFFMNVNPNTTVTVCTAFHYKQNTTTKQIGTNINEDCSDVVDEEVFRISLILGAVFAMGYILIGVVINLTGKKILLAVMLALSGVSGLCLNVVQDYVLLVVMMALFLMAGTCVGIINTIVVDIYPTRYRAMAMAISLMLGRFGAVAGSNILGSLLEYSCQLSLYIFAGEYLVLVVIALLLPIPFQAHHHTATM
ncbi:uncharacterized protein CBL_05251 [Carabus blaptoides fortunei]